MTSNAGIRPELTSLKNILDSWANNKGLEIRYEKRGIGFAGYCFCGNKNDCQIYSKANGTTALNESMPHISVWLYSDKASVHLCVNKRNNKTKIQQLDALVQNGNLCSTSHIRKIRRHYKKKNQNDITIQLSTNSHEGSIKTQLNDLYNVVKNYL